MCKKLLSDRIPNLVVAKISNQSMKEGFLQSLIRVCGFSRMIICFEERDFHHFSQCVKRWHIVVTIVQDLFRNVVLRGFQLATENVQSTVDVTICPCRNGGAPTRNEQICCIPSVKYHIRTWAFIDAFTFGFPRIASLYTD